MDKVVENLVVFSTGVKDESAASKCILIGENLFIINIQRHIIVILSRTTLNYTKCNPVAIVFTTVHKLVVIH